MSAQREFDLKSQLLYDFRPKLHDSKFNYHFITPILKSQSIIVNINILFLLLHFHFDGLNEGCDLEQKMV